MAKCGHCGKGPQFGHNRSHSMRATNRRFEPNIIKRHIEVNGETKPDYICARCLRTEMKPKRARGSKKFA
ncbi:MAG: 50S ribosomal protein L28 [Chloroflexota bacterium]